MLYITTVVIPLKKYYPDTEVLCVRVSPYTRVEDQISTFSDLSFFHYT